MWVSAITSIFKSSSLKYWGYVGGAVVVVLVSWYQYRQGYKDAQQDAEHNALVQSLDNANKAKDGLIKAIDEATSRVALITYDFKNFRSNYEAVKTKNPLSVDCRLDDERLHIITDLYNTDSDSSAYQLKNVR